MKQRKKHIRNGVLLVLLTAGIAAPAAQGRPLAKSDTVSPATSARGSGEIRSESRAKLQSALALGMQGSSEIRSESRARLQSALALGSERSGEIRSESRAKLHSALALGMQGSSEIRSESRARLQSALALGSERSGEIRSESVAKLRTAHALPARGAVTVSGDGFDWRYAGIGVGVVFGSAMLLGAFAISRRRQVHPGF